MQNSSNSMLFAVFLLYSISVCFAIDAKVERMEALTVCQYGQPCSLSYTTSWHVPKEKPEKERIFLTYIDPRCLAATNWCIGGCLNLHSIDVTGKSSHTQQYSCETLVFPIAHFHTGIFS